MDETIKVYKVKPNKIYRLIKLREDGKQEYKGVGHASDIIVGHGAICSNWFTTIVQDIIKTGKGCIFETMNSTYLLEEYDSFQDEV